MGPSPVNIPATWTLVSPEGMKFSESLVTVSTGIVDFVGSDINVGLKIEAYGLPAMFSVMAAIGDPGIEISILFEGVFDFELGE